MIKVDKEQLERMMKNLNLTKAEALELIQSDRSVDRMKDSEVNADLTEEQKQTVKKYSNAGTRKTSTTYKLDAAKKPRKANEAKRTIMELLETTIGANADAPPTILNPEREMEFMWGGTKYKITLSAPRK